MKITTKQDLDIIINALIDLVDEVYGGGASDLDYLNNADSELRSLKVRLDKELV